MQIKFKLKTCYLLANFEVILGWAVRYETSFFQTFDNN